MVKFSKSTLGKIIKFIVAVGSLVVSTPANMPTCSQSKKDGMSGRKGN